MRRILTLAIFGACALLLWGDQARAGFLRVSDADGGGGPYVNLIMREVRVSPIRAHVGDVIRVDMVIADQSDVTYARGDLDLLANGRIVASRRVDHGFGGQGERIHRETIQWNTRGVKPGEYKIRAEFHVWGDASPFDNFLDIKEPLVLQPQGTAFPSGEPGGGAAQARDPRYKPAGIPQ
jgi:hypothetical protein